MTLKPSAAVNRIRVEDKSLEVLLWGIPDARDSIVLLHEALGSASYWKDFPAQLAQSTGARVLAYSRAGHGDSEGPIEPRSAEYYRRQVEVVLPGIMQQFAIAEPILYGHSEGAAIALLYAASGRPAKAVIAEAPIVAPGVGTLQTVEQMDQPQPRAELIEKLGRYHRDAEAVFSSWVEGVRGHLSRELPAARYLKRVRCPVLVLEGALDPFAAPAQAAVLEAGISGLKRVLLANAGHLPHREEPQIVIETVTRFLTEPLEATGESLVVRRDGEADLMLLEEQS